VGLRTLGSLKLKLLAALLLRAMAREQNEKGKDLVSPRDRGVADRLGLEPDSPALAAAERYLVLQGHIRDSSRGHNDGSFTITVAGWEELGYQPAADGWRRRPWWKRMLGV
jgi:hypothetical protein